MKNILLQPILSEKSLAGADAGKYVFKVASDSNKHQVAEAIEGMYKVEVTKVNIINIQPLDRLVRGRVKAHRAGFKKAIITLKKGQKLEGFEFKD